MYYLHAPIYSAVSTFPRNLCYRQMDNYICTSVPNFDESQRDPHSESSCMSKTGRQENIISEKA